MHFSQFCYVYVVVIQINMLVVDVFKELEKDLVEEAKMSGVHNFSSLLFEHHIINSSDLDLVSWLGNYLPPEKLSVILVEIIANNVKNPSIYKAFINVLQKVSTLHYLHNKVEVLLGW